MIGPRVGAGVVLLFIFGSGVVTGMFVERHHPDRIQMTISAAAEHGETMADMREALGLDDQQVEAIEAILAERQHVVQILWEQLRPEVQQAMRQVHAEIGDLLRPDQRERYHDWLNRRREQGLPH